MKQLMLVMFVISMLGWNNASAQVDSADAAKKQRELERNQKEIKNIQGKIDKKDRKMEKALRRAERKERKKDKQENKLRKAEKKREEIRRDTSGVSIRFLPSGFTAAYGNSISVGRYSPVDAAVSKLHLRDAVSNTIVRRKTTAAAI